MKQNSRFPIRAALGGFLFAIIGCTYGKWEYLSWRYAPEFYLSIKQTSDNGCLSAEYPKVVKVIDYSQNSALIWFKGESGNTYIARPWRSSKQTNWQFEKIGGAYGKYCDIDIINSQTGGSADGHYWYN